MLLSQIVHLESAFAKVYIEGIQNTQTLLQILLF